jgi:hypothetical protein
MIKYNYGYADESRQVTDIIIFFFINQLDTIDFISIKIHTYLYTHTGIHTHAYTIHTHKSNFRKFHLYFYGGILMKKVQLFSRDKVPMRWFYWI